MRLVHLVAVSPGAGIVGAVEAGAAASAQGPVLHPFWAASLGLELGDEALSPSTHFRGLPDLFRQVAGLVRVANQIK